jgi:Skp family chaperone for outer membrane proteins
MKMQHVLIVFGLLVVGLYTLVDAQTETVKSSQPTAVAVVDWAQLYQGLDEKLQFEVDQKSAGEKVEAERKAKEDHLRGLQSDLNMLTPTAPGSQAKRDEANLAIVEYRIWTEYQNKKLVSEAGRRVEDLYRRSLKVIALVADENGYGLVLFKESAPIFAYENARQLFGQIMSRKMLYSSDAIDITDQVLQQMNNDFAVR